MALMARNSKKASVVVAIMVMLVFIESMDGHVVMLDSYNCNGSSLCKGLAQSDCDAARRQIQAGNRYFTGGNKGRTGVCSGKCGLFVSGSNCDLTGQEMIDAFNELRSNGYAKCGIKTFSDECKFKADYVTGC